MKKLLITLILIANAIFLFTACEPTQPLDQILKNDPQRAAIMDSIIAHQPYRMEMMNAMLQNDSCRQLMGQKMMEKPDMMGVMMSNPKNMKGTMEHMVSMADKDTVMFNDMVQMMKGKPEMWNKIMNMEYTATKTE